MMSAISAGLRFIASVAAGGQPSFSRQPLGRPPHRSLGHRISPPIFSILPSKKELKRCASMLTQDPDQVIAPKQ